MNACLASTIILCLSLVDPFLLEISEPRYRKCSVCLIEFPFKKSVSLGTVSSRAANSVDFCIKFKFDFGFSLFCEFEFEFCQNLSSSFRVQKIK